MKAAKSAQTLPPKQRDELLAVLKTRFENNPKRHVGLDWIDVHPRLVAAPAKLRSLAQMEETGGEPDVVGRDAATGEYLFVDCSAQSPSGRHSLCYDRAALDARKTAKPVGSALDLAAEMGVEILDEAQYYELQQLGEFDTKTSSWLRTPAALRALGGALFGDRRYDRVFIYHNGAQSYFAGRGFRASLKV